MKIPAKFLISVGLWWVGWLACAKIDNSFSVSEYTVYLVLFCILMLQLGGWIALLLNSTHRLVGAKVSVSSKNEKKSIFDSNKIPVALLIIQFVLLFFSVKYFMVTENFREAVFEKTSEIWGSVYVIYVYDMLLLPAALVWVIKRMGNGSDLSKNLRIAFIIFLLDSLIKMGRTSLYIYMLILMGAWLRGSIKMSPGGFFGIVACMFTLGVLIFGLRYGGGFSYDEFDILGHVFASILAYHMAGFGILDQFTSQLVAFGSDHPPVLWLGFMEGLLGAFLKILGSEDTSLFAQFGEFLQGVVITTETGFYNAFGTNILPFYLDGGVAFSSMAFFMLGFLMIFNPKGDGSVTSVGVLVWILMMVGIFQPVIIGPLFYVGLVMICLDYFVWKFKKSFVN
jgi:hypothetical protein